MPNQTINITYQGQNLTLVHIAPKEDGKNSSDYDGTWVDKEAHNLPENKSLDPNTPKHPQDYTKGLYFLKKFPDGDLIVEGFAETVLGGIISRFIKEGFIPPEYQDCFSPAEAITLPNGDLALLQPFAQGYKPIYKLDDPNQKKRNTFWEVLRKKIWGIRYEYILQNCQPTGLSFIIALMIIFADYSWHSGNFLYKDLPNGIRIFKKIDQGAGLRSVGNTDKVADIFTSLDITTRWINTHKHYPNYYRHIPGFFERAVEHGKVFYEKVSSPEQQVILQNIIKEEVTKAYILLQEHSKEKWPSVRQRLFSYVLNINDLTPLALDENGYQQKFANDVNTIFMNRLLKLAAWKRKPTIFEKIASYFSKQEPLPQQTPEKRASNHRNSNQNKPYESIIRRPHEEQTDDFVERLTSSSTKEPPPPLSGPPSFSFDGENPDRLSIETALVSAYRSEAEIQWTPRQAAKASNSYEQIVTDYVQVLRSTALNPTKAANNLIRTARELAKDRTNLQTLVSILNDIFAVTRKENINDPILAATIEGLRGPQGFLGRKGNTVNYRRVVSAYKKAILTLVKSLDPKDQAIYLAQLQLDALLNIKPTANSHNNPATSAPIKSGQVTLAVVTKDDDTKVIGPKASASAFRLAYRQPNQTADHLIKDIQTLGQQPANLQRLIVMLNNMLAAEQGEKIEDFILAATIKGLRTPPSIWNKTSNTADYQRVVHACKTAIANILAPLTGEQRKRLLAELQPNVSGTALVRHLLNTNSSGFHRSTTASAKRFSKLLAPPCQSGWILSGFLGYHASRQRSVAFGRVKPPNRSLFSDHA